MKNRGVITVAVILIIVIAIAGSAPMLVGKKPGTRFLIPVGNVANEPAKWHFPAQPFRGGDRLFMYVSKEDYYPEVVQFLKGMGLYPSRPEIVVPTMHWLVLNMDPDTFFRVSEQLNSEKIEIEILSENSCFVVDSRVDPKYFRSTPVRAEDYPLPFDVQQRYPQYFSATSPAPRK